MNGAPWDPDADERSDAQLIAQYSSRGETDLTAYAENFPEIDQTAATVILEALHGLHGLYAAADPGRGFDPALVRWLEKAAAVNVTAVVNDIESLMQILDFDGPAISSAQLANTAYSLAQNATTAVKVAQLPAHLDHTEAVDGAARHHIAIWTNLAALRMWQRYAPVRAAHVAQEDAKRAEAQAERDRLDAAVAAQAVLAEKFETIALAEKRLASTFRLTAVATVLFIPLLIVVSSTYVDNWQDRSVLALGISVPFFAVAGYLTREASQHRRVARWASTIDVQLRTLEGFIKVLTTDELRDKLLSEFGTRVFGPMPDPTSSGGDSTELVTALTVLERAVEALARRGA